MTDIDLFDPKNMVCSQITHFGWRQDGGETDFIIGFMCIGPFKDNTRQEFLWASDPGLPPNHKIENWWAPTLRNTQGFLQRGPHGPVPFEFPRFFEPVDDPYIKGKHLEKLTSVGRLVYLACCTVEGCDGSMTLVGMTTPEG
jgi:hypothetical protein